MGQGGYIWSADKDEVEELGRLKLQEGIVDPTTIRHLETIGVAEGWKCLEVGAGAGSIARWLHQHVGPAGKVVATDIDTRFLHRLAAPNLEIRQHNILRDGLEKDEYDLVHCRRVLHHLTEPEKALKKMADALRGGGWLLLEEDDHGSILSSDVTDSSIAWYTSKWRELYDHLRRKGIVDYYFGRRVRSLVEGLGFTDVGQEGITRMVRGGDSSTRVWGTAMRQIGKIWIAEGLLTEMQYDGMIRLYEDPSFNYLGLTMFCAWGRKPVQGRT